MYTTVIYVPRTKQVHELFSLGKAQLPMIFPKISENFNGDYNQAANGENLYAELTWGMNDIFKTDFDTISFAMYPIYLNVGFGYAFQHIVLY